MGRARNQRHKKEGSFLEHVSESLKLLHEEIATIKDTLNSLKLSPYSVLGEPSNYSYNSSCWFLPEYYGCDVAEDRLPANLSHASSNLEGLLAEETEVIGVSYCGDMDSAIPSLPNATQTITRHSFLAYRASIVADSGDNGSQFQNNLKSIDADLCVSNVFVEQASFVKTCARCAKSCDQCICHDLYCRGCVRAAVKCECARPLVRMLRCRSCRESPFNESIWDCATLAGISMNKACEECGMDLLVEAYFAEGQDEEFYLLQGASECHECLRVDGQEVIQACDAVCGHIYHRSCMKNACNPSGCLHDISLYICSSCDQNGDLVQCGLCLQDSVIDETGENMKVWANAGKQLWSEAQVVEWMTPYIHQALLQPTRDLQISFVFEQLESIRDCLEGDLFEKVFQTFKKAIESLASA